MGLDCCSSFSKYILFALNFLFWLIGVVLLGVGIWALADKNAVELFRAATEATSETLVRGSAATLCIVGGFIFFVAFFGCFGACKESVCMLTTYSVIVGILLAIQILAGIMGVVYKDQILDQLGESMNRTVTEKYGVEGFEETTQSWDYMQRLFGCCGAMNGPEDWKESAWYINQTIGDHHPVPLTCCKLTNQNAFNEEPIAVDETKCYFAAQHLNHTHLQGKLEGKPQDYLNIQACEPRLSDWVEGHAKILIGVAFGLGFIQLFGIIFACCITKSVRQQYEYV